MEPGWSAEVIAIGEWAVSKLTLPIGGLVGYLGLMWAVRKAGWPWPLSIGAKKPAGE